MTRPGGGAKILYDFCYPTSSFHFCLHVLKLCLNFSSGTKVKSIIQCLKKYFLHFQHHFNIFYSKGNFCVSFHTQQSKYMLLWMAAVTQTCQGAQCNQPPTITRRASQEMRMEMEVVTKGSGVRTEIKTAFHCMPKENHIHAQRDRRVSFWKRLT